MSTFISVIRMSTYENVDQFLEIRHASKNKNAFYESNFSALQRRVKIFDELCLFVCQIQSSE